MYNAPMKRAKLVVKEGSNRGAVMPLERDPAWLGRDAGCSIQILDAQASRRHAKIAGIGESPVLEDPGSRNGTFVNGVRCGAKTLSSGDEIRIGSTVLLFLTEPEAPLPPSRRPATEDDTVPAEGASREEPVAGGRETWKLRGGVPAERMVGTSEAMLFVFSLIHKAGPSGVPVLVTGESGTGKELVARAVHLNSQRRDGPFVAVNVAALPAGLVESELFGHERGAFSGAVARKIGRFEEADGGTLFLDEIGEMDGAAQASLLRACEEGRIRRVGGEAPLPVDVRVIAATNRPLPAALKEGRLRKDLYYRLRGIEIALPPLRDRREDIPLLAEHFFDGYRRKFPGGLEAISGETMERMKAYAWPGNVRELRNAIERAMIVAEGETLDVSDLPREVRTGKPGPRKEPFLSLAEVENRHLQRALRIAGDNKTRAAQLLGIHRKTLYSKMKRHGIEP